MKETTSDTKSQIFNTALRLFAENGYENVSVRDIAKAVGIKAASIYNHFENKEQILEACYAFYLKNRNILKLNREQYEPIVRSGTKKDFMNIFNYSWEASIHENMFFALLIVYSRVYTDTRAREIYASEISASMQYLKEVFDYGIEIGRLDNFNVPTVSLIVLSTRLFAAHSATITTEQKAEWHNAQVDFMNELVRIVPFKY